MSGLKPGPISGTPLCRSTSKRSKRRRPPAYRSPRKPIARSQLESARINCSATQLNAAQLHSLGVDAKAVSLLKMAVDLKPLPSVQMEEIPPERMRVVQTISTLSRDSSFRSMVLSSYRNTCAVSSTQLRLVDAAHILPVGAKGSSDRIQNGICLAPTYHRAYDLGII